MLLVLILMETCLKTKRQLAAHYQMSQQMNRIEKEIRETLAREIMFIDGAMGTMIQLEKLEEKDFRGTRFANHPSDLKGNNDLLVITKPDLVKRIHRKYLQVQNLFEKYQNLLFRRKRKVVRQQRLILK